VLWPRCFAGSTLCCPAHVPAGLAQTLAVTSSPTAALQGSAGADCSVPGFTFRPNVVPSLAKPLGRLQNPVQLYTLPYTPPKDGSSGTNSIMPAPLANLPATVAACQADAGCGLFTSDGYIIGAYRTLSDPNRELVSREADIFKWQPMHVCTSACCGTWVADGLIPSLLQPVPKTPGTNVRTIQESKLPTDGLTQYELNPELRTTACIGKPPPKSVLLGGAAASPPGSPECPQRCLTACCKQLTSGDTIMGNFFFSQCSGEVCKLCGYSNSAVAGWSPMNVLMRQYVRDKSRGPAAAAGVGGVTNCRKTSGGTAAAGSSNLC
jgi:hypothetical protein